MIAEFSIVPIGREEGLSQYVAECIKLVRASGLRYELTPMGTVVQGPYDDVMETISSCHKKIRTMSNQVLTEIKIDDRLNERPLEQRIASVERKL
ncbi:MAG: hypothetical protein A4E32_00375 [Methanomassiliicoccales archaeon PtaU1.Bin124]|nr:MAG: hypothetical protein A4E32_00375 [Methanomassiliicoccales archaeon PtaU1.Bin124]